MGHNSLIVPNPPLRDWVKKAAQKKAVELTKPKKYIGVIKFKSFEITVMANSKKEAREKIHAKALSKSTRKLLDRKNCSINEVLTPGEK